ncbi:MAG: PaaI family thioesterase [Actinomycetota bacterium]|nr:PaaI family thioesterase [Actinomycetota bacterium]
MITPERAQQILTQQPFCQWWDYRLGHLGEGEAEVVLPDAGHLYRPGGYIHGAAVAGLADVAFWLALMTVAGEQQMALTLNMSSNFLRGAVGELRAVGRVMRHGRRVVYGQAHTYDRGKQLVAHHTLTYLLPSSA